MLFRIKLTTKTFIWHGLNSSAILQNMGPRPLFVRTAYAAPTVVVLSEVDLYGFVNDPEALMLVNPAPGVAVDDRVVAEPRG